MKKQFSMAMILVLLLGWPFSASGHYGMVIPSDTMVMQADNRTLTLTLSFSHPFEGIGMELEKPGFFAMTPEGQKTDLKGQLVQTRVMGQTGWQLHLPVKRPGITVFYMEPVPYFEPTEDCYIIHHTKTVVAAFGDDEGWDKPMGLKTEIVPLAKPFGLYAGNVFQGMVMLDQKPVPFSVVEIEYYNRENKAAAPTDYMVTQTIKADANGVFTYAVPQSGWWGFAALNPSEKKMARAGEDKDVELGAVIWVYFHGWMEK